MDEETKRALERAGLQLVEAAEALREASAILGGDLVDLALTWQPARNSFGTVGGCERHNRVNCTRCERGR